jgi:hypothetical protein
MRANGGDIPLSGPLDPRAFTPETPANQLANLWVASAHDTYTRAVSTAAYKPYPWLDPRLIIPNNRYMVVGHMGVVVNRLSQEVLPEDQQDNPRTMGARPQQGRLVHDTLSFMSPTQAGIEAIDGVSTRLPAGALFLERTVELPRPSWKSDMQYRFGTIIQRSQ